MIRIIKSKKVIYRVVWRINIKIAILTPFYLAVHCDFTSEVI